MALKDNPGLTTMPRTERDWTKFINELSGAVTGVSTEPPIPDPGDPDYPTTGPFVTLETNQTITGLKTFSGNNPRWNSFPLWSNDNAGTQIGLLTADVSPADSDSVITTANKKVSLSQISDVGLEFFMVD